MSATSKCFNRKITAIKDLESGGYKEFIGKDAGATLDSDVYQCYAEEESEFLMQ